MPHCEVSTELKGRIHLFGTLQVSSKAHQQVMGDGIHQVEEGCIFVEDFIEECSFQSQVLQKKKKNRHTAEHLGKEDHGYSVGNTLRTEKYPSNKKVEQEDWDVTGMMLSWIQLLRRAQLREETSPLPILHAAARRNE